jgi:hypothetical protein
MKANRRIVEFDEDLCNGCGLSRLPLRFSEGKGGIAWMSKV